MNFGVPSQRATKKAEKYPNQAVLTVGIDGGKGTSRAMSLNSKAVEALGLPEEGAVVAFGFDVVPAGQENAGDCTASYIMNGNQEGIPDAIKMRVTKGNPRKISEKRTYEYLSKKAFTLNNSVENEFLLEKVAGEEGSIATFKLSLMGAETVEETINETATDLANDLAPDSVDNQEPQADFNADEAAQAFAGTVSGETI